MAPAANTLVNPDDLGHLAVELAVGAGRLAREGRQRHFEIAVKSTQTDLVTAVDTSVEAWLRDQIAARRSGDGIVGEEGDDVRTATGVRWYVDPIDGTVNFVLGLPQYAVSVAAEVDGAIVAGCVHNPETGEIFRAVAGGGAYLSDGRATERRLGGPRRVPLEQAVVGTGFAYNPDVRSRQGSVVAALLPILADIRRCGSAALDLCALADGRLDAFFEAGLNPWDWSAGLLIAREAGLVASGLRGRPPGRQMIALAPPGLAEQFFGLLEQSGADSAWADA